MYQHELLGNNLLAGSAESLEVVSLAEEEDYFRVISPLLVHHQTLEKLAIIASLL